jgi:hypothetical protein
MSCFAHKIACDINRNIKVPYLSLPF